MKKWLRDKIAAITIAISNVEKNSLGQNGKTLESLTGEERRNTEGTLADSLVQGEVTQEVKNLRWRTYKILKEVNNKNLQISGFDDNGLPILQNKNDQNLLKKIKIDRHDDYELELVVDNSEITNSVLDVLDGINERNVTSNDFFALNKTKKPINIERSFIPKFEIEKYTKKLNVRKIDEDKKLLEFYVSKYPDEYNFNSKLFLKEINKVITNGPRNINFLEIDNVSFLTDKTLGAVDFLFFEYEILSFNKIIEFDGYYVIKFISKVSINGDDILSIYKEEGLERKYENKEAKKTI